jgi:hypothetical protein
LSLPLVAALNVEKPGLNLKFSFGEFLKLVPTRLSTSQSLSDALACCLAAHNTTLRGAVMDTDDWKLYGKALASLQAALKDPEESLQTGTLCVATILQ